MRKMTCGAAAVVLIALSGCGLVGADDKGGGGRGDGGKEPTAAEREDAMLEYAQCMRDHGVAMEDPEPGGQGGVLVNGQEFDEATVRAAEEECGHLMEDVLPDAGEMEIDAEQKEEMLAQAQCMRERGYEMPDPQFDGGRVEMRLGDGIDPMDPTFQNDQAECAEESGMELPRMEGAG